MGGRRGVKSPEMFEDVICKWPLWITLTSTVHPPVPLSSQRSRHALFGNVPLNGLNEWNVHKLGWLKHDRVSRMSRGVPREEFPISSTITIALRSVEIS